MVRRWSFGAVAAVVLGIATTLSVAATGMGAEWRLSVSLSPFEVELSATTQGVRIALTL